MHRVLIVDDDENNRTVATDALECDEFELVEAVDGHDCLRQVAKQSMDLILLDVMMPGIDGIETLRKLKANEATQQIPVIMLTALNMDSQVAACLDEGAIDHIAKPFSSMILRARVRAALRCKAESRAVDATPQPRGKTLALVGAKGGVGTTTLAINIGAKLVQVGKTAIVYEMQPNAVSSVVQLGLTPHGRPGELWGGDKVCISNRTVEDHLLKHVTSLRVLQGPKGPDSDVDLDPKAVSDLLQVMREIAQFTILDVGNSLNPNVQEFLRQVDQIMVVMEMEPCSLVAAQQRLGHFTELGICPSMLGVVINSRVRLPSPPVGLNAIRENLNRDIVGIIPADPEGCFAAIRQASPIVLSRPNSTTAGALTSLTNRITADSPVAVEF